MAAHAMPRLGRGAALWARRQRPSSCSGAFPYQSKDRTSGLWGRQWERGRASAALATAVVARPVPWHSRRRSSAWGQHVHRRRGPSGCTR